VLELFKNRLTSLPMEIGQLVNLRVLSVSDNFLCQLPSTIGHLCHLHIFNLQCNRLRHLPDTIGLLTNLHTLNVNGNHLVTLPSSIGNLSTLTLLDIRGNPFTDIPHELIHLYHLNVALVSFNCRDLQSPIREFLNGQSLELKPYLEGKQEQDTYWQLIKVLWLGKLKNPPESCLFARLPMEIFCMILREAQYTLDQRKITAKLFGNKISIDWNRFLRMISKLWKISIPEASSLRFLLERDHGQVTLPDWKRFNEWFSLQHETPQWTLSEMMAILQQRWFFGFLDALEAKRYLQGQPIGTFLVRFSATPGWFVLSVNQRKVIHWRIATEADNDNKRHYILCKKSFECILELIQNHELGKEPLCIHGPSAHNDDCYLTNPADRNNYVKN